MYKSTIKIGVVGCAQIANRMMLPAILALPELFELKAIASRDKNKANDFSSRFGVKAYYDYEAIIDDTAINAVYIPLPNSLHYIWIKKSLLAGKHVLVEKSLSCTHKEAVELNTLAKHMQLVLMENFQFRFHKQLTIIKNFINEGAIGELRNVKSAFGFPPFPNKSNIRYQKDLGGGALLDAGAYPLKLIQEILGEDIYVDSANLHIDPKLGVDTWGAAQIKLKQSKLVAQVSFGFDQYYMCNVELWGSKGVITANRIFTSPPGEKAIIKLISDQGDKEITVPQDNHFINLLTYFANLVRAPSNNKVSVEYKANINQALLIQQVKDKSGEQ